MTDLSPLQKARYQYAPKLPKMLRNGISEISVLEGTKYIRSEEAGCRCYPFWWTGTWRTQRSVRSI